eukprot:scaffold269_cov123-Isochrysis_galbana.AAC.14
MTDHNCCVLCPGCAPSAVGVRRGISRAHRPQAPVALVRRVGCPRHSVDAFLPRLCPGPQPNPSRSPGVRLAGGAAAGSLQQWGGRNAQLRGRDVRGDDARVGVH